MRKLYFLNQRLNGNENGWGNEIYNYQVMLLYSTTDVRIIMMQLLGKGENAVGDLFDVSLTDKMGNANVMFVDDDEDFAKVHIPIWERTCQIGFVYASDAETAIKNLEKYPIKVVIIDQIMPTPGNVLFGQLKAVDSRIKTILLSVEMKEYLVEATRIGFDYAMLKSKKDLPNLPSVVLGLISKYNHEIQSKKLKILQDFYVYQKRLFFFGPKFEVRYSILDYITIDEERVVGDWHTYEFVEVGQELTSEKETSIEREFKFSKNFSIENENSLNLSADILQEFKGSLALKMEKAFEDTYTEKVKEVFRRKNTLSIPSNSMELVSRSYEYAKTVKVMKVYLETKCTCCNCTSIDPITITMPIPVIALRIVEHYKDREPQYVDAGKIR